MIYKHRVKHNGVVYPAGTDVPVGNIIVEPKKEESKPVEVEKEEVKPVKTTKVGFKKTKK